MILPEVAMKEQMISNRMFCTGYKTIKRKYYTVLKLNFSESGKEINGRLVKILEKISQSEKNIVVDLNGCEFPNLKLLSELIQYNNKLKEKNKSIKILWSSRFEKSILSILRINRIFELYENEKSFSSTQFN